METKNKSRKKRLLKHLGNVGMAMLSFSLLTSPVSAVEPNEILGSESGRQATKEAIDAALKMARSKPAMSAATTIVCLACLPAAGAVASPGMCIACGILIAKTFG